MLMECRVVQSGTYEGLVCWIPFLILKRDFCNSLRPLWMAAGGPIRNRRLSAITVRMEQFASAVYRTGQQSQNRELGQRSFGFHHQVVTSTGLPIRTLTAVYRSTSVSGALMLTSNAYLAG